MDDRPIDADVVVIGGGPAGSATAIACALRGLRVVVCDRDRPGRDRPGETLHPGIEPVLAQLGVAHRLPQIVGARHAGIWVTWGGPGRFEAFGGDADGPWQGFQVWRATFDTMLLDRARELGVTVHHRCAVTGLLRAETALRGVQTAAGPITARMVVDASGAARWLGRALGISSPRRSRRLIARYGYVAGACPERDDAPALVGEPAGWTWSARVRPGVYQWTRVYFDERPPADAVPDELRGLAPMGRVRGADVTWRMAMQAAGPDWFMVGDAAALLDPTSSHGVLKALLTGITAGHMIAARLDDKAPEPAIAAAYHDWVAERFATDARRLRTFYRNLGAAASAWAG